MYQEHLREIQLAGLEMLRTIVEILETHGVRYYLSGGSVLGAVRHQGFIPWDDDVDIMVYREDYEKLNVLFENSLPRNLTFQNFTTCADFPYVFSRVMLDDSALVFRGRQHLSFHHGIHVDIQPIDKVPEGKKFKRFALLVRACKTLLNVRYLNEYKDGKKRPLHQRFIIWLVAITFNKYQVHAICYSVMTRYRTKPTTWCACLGGIYGEREGFPSWVLGNGVMMDFEGYSFVVPTHYDIYLKQLYGDYMKEPPESERYKHHDVVFVSLSEEYSP